MEGRRTSSRSRLRSSPARTARKSPSKKPHAPPGKSPSGKASPTQKGSPNRKRGKAKTSLANFDSKVENKEITKEKFEQESTQTSIKITPRIFNASPEKKDTSSSVHSVNTTTSSSTVVTTKTIETVDFGTTKVEDTSGDSEIAKLTSVSAFVRRSVSVSKNLTPTYSTYQSTPTPTASTGQSRQTHSRSVSRSVYDDDYSKTEYSDNENEEHYASFHEDIACKVRNLQIRPPEGNFIVRELSSTFVTLFAIAIPVLVHYLQSPFYFNFDFKKLSNISDLKGLQDYLKFGYKYLGAYMVYFSGIFILSAFPFGRVVKLYTDRGTIEYYFNSIAVGSIATIVFITTEYLGYQSANFITTNYLFILDISAGLAIILAIWCYIHSKSVSPNLWNPYAKSGCTRIDAAIGREINPKLFQTIDIKLACYRISIITTLVFAEVFLYKSFNFENLQSAKYELENNNATATALDMAKYFIQSTQFDPTSLLESVLLLTYVCDLIFYEHHLATSFELQQEGVGILLLVRYSVTPFLLAAIPKYFSSNHGIELPYWANALTIVLFVLGLILKRISNKIKYRYRINPHTMEFAYADTVPTFQGKRLLLGKLWGSLRQPNYTGDVIALLSFAIPLYWKFSLFPLISLSLIIIYLFYRAVRVNKRNFARYDSAWIRYCTKVKYMMIPKLL